MVKISSIFVAFLENTNFNTKDFTFSIWLVKYGAPVKFDILEITL